jgi:hypothetical protein
MDTVDGDIFTWDGGAQQGKWRAPSAIVIGDTGAYKGESSPTATEFSHLAGTTSAIQAQLNAKAPLASPAFTGVPTAPTAAAGTNTTQLSTTAFVQTAIANLVDSSPGTLDTLNELAAALGDDPNFATTVATALAGKQPLDATLTALAAFNSNGFLVQTAADTFAARSLVQPAAGFTVTNGDGVSGSPTFALANDLAALESLSSTGFAVRTATDAWAQRTITGTANQVSVSNGSGVSGNPTLSLPQDIHTGATPQFAGATFTGNVLLSATTANLYLKDTSTGFQAASSTVVTLQASNAFRSPSFTSGLLGWNVSAAGDAEFNNLRVRGEIASAVFKVSEISATAGTLGVFYSASTVTEDFTTPASTSSSFTFKAKNSDAGGMLFAVGDVVRFKTWTGSGVSDSWATVTARTNNTTYTTYTATLSSGSTSATFRAGSAVVDYGASGTGFITLSTDGTVGSSPNMTMATHAGSPWSAFTTLLRAGNLNGSYGYASNVYGFGAGQYGQANVPWLTVDTTNGLRIGGGASGTTQLAQWDTSGNILIGRTGANQSNVYISAGAVQFRNNTTALAQINADGSAFFGNGNFAVSAAGVLTASGWTLNPTSLNSGTTYFASGFDIPGSGQTTWMGKSASGYQGFYVRDSAGRYLEIIGEGGTYPRLRVNDGTHTRVLVGGLDSAFEADGSTASMGMKVWSAAGVKLVEFSDVQNIIGGWSLGSTTITGTNVTLDSSGKVHSGITAYNSNGSGWIFDNSTGTPKFRVGTWQNGGGFDEATNAIWFDGSNIGITSPYFSSPSNGSGLLLAVANSVGTTSAMYDVATVARNSSGTPAAGYGASFVFNLQSATVTNRNAARIGALWTTATDASRTSAFVFQLVNAAASLAEVVRITGAGRLGVGTAAPDDLLHVKSATGAAGVFLQAGGAGGASWVWFSHATGDDFPAGMGFWSSGSGYGLAIKSDATLRCPGYGAGAASFDSSGNLLSSSDERLKDIKGKFTDGLAALRQIEPITYEWKHEQEERARGGLTYEGMPGGEARRGRPRPDPARFVYHGFGARNVQKAIPGAVGVNADGTLTLQDRAITAALVNAVKELEARLIKTELELETLRGKVKT